ncbi:hypothetical protein K435DRAFT_872937 [Dendrothele bispora CBS 962.96]|uniref:Uncharacterized protein n=1 Tax=Dendrothele bispora (strain CBS 962.96) TaxID=1314807 RepID=A0A4S8L0N9_DENBC|nr:hypothetical protein K435DRAFT_872937 [Dendrothele bispora CBS 962.96]
MLPDTYIKKYGTVARLFSGGKQEMWRQLNVRLVELAHSVAPRDQRVLQHMTKLQVQMNLAFDGDWENFGRFYVVTHEPRESGYGPPFSTDIFFLSGRGTWQDELMKDPEIQSLLAMRESLETGGRVQTLPRYVLRRVSDRRRGEPFLPPNWNHATSSCRLLTPGRTSGGEDPKKEIRGRTRGRDFTRNERYSYRRDGVGGRGGVAYTLRSRSPRSRSPARASYRPELQHWSVPRSGSPNDRHSHFERIHSAVSGRDDPTRYGSSQSSGSSVRSMHVAPRFVRDSDAAEDSDRRESSPFDPYTSPSYGRGRGRDSWGLRDRQVREGKGRSVLGTPDTERADRDHRWQVYKRDMGIESDDGGNEGEGMGNEEAVLSIRKGGMRKKERKLKESKKKSPKHAARSLRTPLITSAPEVIEIMDTDEEEEIHEKRRAAWEKKFLEGRLLSSDDELPGPASSDDELPSIIGKVEKCEKVQAFIWMKNYQKITTTLKTYNGRFSPSRNKLELGNYGLETNMKLEALTKVIDERTGFEGKQWKKILWADSFKVMDGNVKIAIREAGLVRDDMPV